MINKAAKSRRLGEAIINPADIHTSL